MPRVQTMMMVLGLVLCAALSACGSDDAAIEGGDESESSEATGAADEGEPEPEDEGEEEAPTVAYEILEAISPSQIITWLSQTISQDEFDAIELDGGWFKNQPRESDVDRGMFARSPSAAADGEFVDDDHYGHPWRHVATIVETGIAMDPEGLLSGNRIVKFHTVEFDAGRTLTLLVSPEGDTYVRVSRDALRTQEVPSVPDTWDLVEVVTPELLSVRLPDETINIRADNEDSFQGPVDLDL